MNQIHPYIRITPRNLQTHNPKLTLAKELLIIKLRPTLHLPLNDLLATFRKLINVNTSKSSPGRYLGRHDASNLTYFSNKSRGSSTTKNLQQLLTESAALGYSKIRRAAFRN